MGSYDGERRCVDGYLSVFRGNVLWLSSQVMVAGGLEVTAQVSRTTEPSVTTIGTGCNTNSEIPEGGK